MSLAIRYLRFWLFLACALSAGLAQAFDPWTVRNFRVEGAQRISEGTIYNYLPINIGDMLTDQRVQEAAVDRRFYYLRKQRHRDGDAGKLVTRRRSLSR